MRSSRLGRELSSSKCALVRLTAAGQASRVHKETALTLADEAENYSDDDCDEMVSGTLQALHLLTDQIANYFAATSTHSSRSLAMGRCTKSKYLMAR